MYSTVWKSKIIIPNFVWAGELLIIVLDVVNTTFQPVYSTAFFKCKEGYTSHHHHYRKRIWHKISLICGLSKEVTLPCGLVQKLSKPSQHSLVKEVPQASNNNLDNNLLDNRVGTIWKDSSLEVNSLIPAKYISGSKLFDSSQIYIRALNKFLFFNGWCSQNCMQVVSDGNAFVAERISNHYLVRELFCHWNFEIIHFIPFERPMPFCPGTHYQTP